MGGGEEGRTSLTTEQLDFVEFWEKEMNSLLEAVVGIFLRCLASHRRKNC